MFRKLAFGALALCLAAAGPVPGFTFPPNDVRLAPWLLGYGTSTAVSVATTSGTLFAANAFSTWVQFCTLPASTSNVWLNPTGAAAVVGQGILIASAGKCVSFGAGADKPMPTTAVAAITDNGSAQSITEVGQ